MPPGPVVRQWNAADWFGRVGLALLACVLGYFSVAQSLGVALQAADPEHAHQLAPINGKTTAAFATKLFLEKQNDGIHSAPAALAQAALLRDPTAVQAVVILGLQAQLRGDVTLARRLFAYSNRLSRRELQTRLWMIEDAVARGDVPATIRNYDIALRTSRSAPDLLFPILSAAVAEPAIRAGLVPVLATKPAWYPDFVARVSTSDGDPAPVADLFRQLRHTGTMVPVEATASVVNRLAERGRYAEAWDFYASLHPNTSRAASRDPHFTAGTMASVFDWTLVNDGGATTTLQSGPHGGVVDFVTPPSVGGALLRQVQLLKPGSYRIAGHSIGIEQPERSLPYWSLTCRTGRELGRVVVPPSAHGNGMFSGRFDVPANCTEQTLTLVARPSDSPSGATGQIDQVRLAPVR